MNSNLTITPDTCQPDPLGLEAWCRSRCLPFHVGLALMSSVLSGVAGRGLHWSLPSVQASDQGTSLCFADNPILTMAVSDLTSKVSQYQDGFLLKAKEFTAEQVDKAMYEPKFQNRNHGLLEEMANPQSQRHGLGSLDWEMRLEADSEMSAVMARYDCLVRPRFMFKGTVPVSLPEALATAHSSIAFLGGCREPLPSKNSKRHERINHLLKSLHGIEVMVGRKSSLVNVTQATGFLHGIIQFSKPDFSWMMSQRRDFFASVTPITLAHQPEPVDFDVEVAAAEFLNHFNQMLSYGLAIRRAYGAAKPGFHDESETVRFLAQQREFLFELQQDSSGIDLSGIAALPSSMACSLLFLRGRRDCDAYIRETIFSAVRKLRDEAVQLFRLHDHADLAERRLEVAKKIVMRLNQLGSAKRRALVRGFDQQGLHLHEPVIRVLIGMRILNESPDLVLTVGKVPLASLSLKNLISPT